MISWFQMDICYVIMNWFWKEGMIIVRHFSDEGVISVWWISVEGVISVHWFSAKYLILVTDFQMEVWCLWDGFQMKEHTLFNTLCCFRSREDASDPVPAAGVHVRPGDGWDPTGCGCQWGWGLWLAELGWGNWFWIFKTFILFF